MNTPTNNFTTSGQIEKSVATLHYRTLEFSTYSFHTSYPKIGFSQRSTSGKGIPLRVAYSST